MTEQHALGRELLFIERVRQPAAGKRAGILGQSGGVGLLMNTGRSANSSEEKIRSGFAALSAATWLVRSIVPTLGHCSVITLCLNIEPLQHRDKRRHLLRPYE